VFRGEGFFFPHEFNKNASGESSSHVVHACLYGFLLLFFPSVSVGFTAEICLVALLAKLTLHCALAHTGVFRGEGFFFPHEFNKNASGVTHVGTRSRDEGEHEIDAHRP
jgi:hypothetical protein